MFITLWLRHFWSSGCSYQHLHELLWSLSLIRSCTKCTMTLGWRQTAYVSLDLVVLKHDLGDLTRPETKHKPSCWDEAFPEAAADTGWRQGPPAGTSGSKQVVFLASTNQQMASIEQKIIPAPSTQPSQVWFSGSHSLKLLFKAVWWGKHTQFDTSIDFYFMI